MHKLFAFFLVATLVGPARANDANLRNPSCDELLLDSAVLSHVGLQLTEVALYPGEYALALQKIMHDLTVHYRFPALDFAFFERFFRRKNAIFYLVANSKPLTPGLRIAYTPAMEAVKPGAVPKFHLWAGVNGRHEAEALKATLGISDAENLRRLSETGFITGYPLDAEGWNDLDLVDEGTVRRLHERGRD